MFSKKIVVSWLVVFISMMVYGFLVFGMALDDFYKEYASNLSMRPEGEEAMHWLALGQLIMAYAFVRIWQYAATEQGIKCGLQYGFFMGIFWAGCELIMAAFMPFATIVMVAGFVGDVLMMIFAGFMLEQVWKKMAD